MNGAALERVFRAAGGRVIAALAARFRDISLAEDAFSEGCLKALRAWPERGVPADPMAWLYRVAERTALDELRRRRVREQNLPEMPLPAPSVEADLTDDARIIPEERLRLIFICCHSAIAPEARAALTLRLVCGLTVTEIARAFLVQEATLAQRLTRAKRKIADAGVPFELPSREDWPERLEAVLSTLEIAYAKAHEDGAGSGRHAGFATEILNLTKLLQTLVPQSGDVHALAALIRYAEARRPARVDSAGVMIPLSEQDPKLWRRDLIDEAHAFLAVAEALDPSSRRVLQARLQRVWSARQSADDPPPWAELVSAYDRLLAIRDDPIARLNRAVALAEAESPAAALAAILGLEAQGLAAFLPYHAVRADLLRRMGRLDEARAAYAQALSLDPPSAERRWLELRLAESQPGKQPVPPLRQ